MQEGDSIINKGFYEIDEELRPLKKNRPEFTAVAELPGHLIHLKPVGTSNQRTFSTSQPTVASPSPAVPSPLHDVKKNKQDIADIIAAAAKAAEEAQRAAAEAAAKLAAQPTVEPKKSSSSRHRSSKKQLTKEEKEAAREAAKEKKLLKLVGAVVVKCMSKYQKQMEHDVFKKHAKDVRPLFHPLHHPFTNLPQL